MIYRYDIILINYVLRKDEESEIMQTLRIEHLTKTYGEKTLFEDADFIINEHDRIGLIGTNGSGKTTLLNAISGIDPADSGELIAPNDYRIGYLKQMSELDDSKTIIEAVFEGAGPIFQTVRNYEEALEAYGADPENEKLAKRYSDAEDKKVSKEKTKLTYAEQMEFDKLEKEIDDLDERKAELQEEMNNVPGSDYGRLGDLQRQIDEIDQRSEEAMERWEYLGQYV